MFLLKGFLRKKKTKEYIRIFIILFSVIFILNVFIDYINKVTNTFKLENSCILIYSKENHEDIFKNKKIIKSYRRAIRLEKGLDNDVIYEPRIITDDKNAEYFEESTDNQKLKWSSLLIDDNVLAYSSSSCKLHLKDNEATLFLVEGYDYNQELKKTYLNKEIVFIYNKKEIPLIISDIKNVNIGSYICISDNLYNDLINKEEHYIYNLEINDYKEYNKLSKKWINLEDNEYYTIKQLTSIDKYLESSSQKILDNVSTLLRILNIISSIIFSVIAIITAKDLILDDEKNIKLLRQIGYNKVQNFFNSIINTIILDIIILLISIMVSLLIILILNIIFNFTIGAWYLIYFIPIVLFIFVIQIIFIISTIFFQTNW